MRTTTLAEPTVYVPVCLLDSWRYLGLPSCAKSLLFDLLAQYNGTKNGKLLTGWKFMSENRGWKSPSTLNRAKAELLDAGFLVQTRYGSPPSTPTWVALIWMSLNWSPEMDITPTEYQDSQRSLVADWMQGMEVKP